MILPEETKPDLSLYFIGAQVLAIMKRLPNKSTNLLVIYEELSKSGKNNVPLLYFLYSLDWLFLLNIITLDHNNNLILCN